MRIIKPQHLSVLHRCFERQKRAYLGVAVMAYVPIGDEVALLPEQEMWQEVTPLMNPEIPLDAGLPKSGAEYLMVGDACSPGGEEVTGLEVEARVGGLHKKLHVYGERYWLDSKRVSDVRKFSRWPLTWEQSWGGAAVEANPLGRGTEPEQTAAGPLLAIPPVQHPDHPCNSPKQASMPASFAPIPPMWPQRKHFDGTYDDAWLKSEFPGPPLDFDWRFHCIASADQWQAKSFTGSEAIEIAHMHPDHPRLQYQLPGIRPVVIARVKRDGGFKDRLGEPCLSTLWLLPNQLRTVMVWHAMFEVADEFADEVELLCVGAEWIDRPKPVEHYVGAIAARLDPEHGAEKLLDDFELLPDGLATPNETMERYRESLGSSGVEVRQINEALDEAERQVDYALKRNYGEEAAAAARQQARRAAADMGIPDRPPHVPRDPTGLLDAGRSLMARMPRASDLSAAISSQKARVHSEITDQLTEAGVGPSDISRLLNPEPPAAVHTPRQLLAQFDDLLHQATRAPDVRMPPMDPKLRALVDRAENMQSAMNRGVAHMAPPPPPIAREAIYRWRDGAARAQELGHSCSGIKLKSGDFSGMNLSRMDFSEAELEGADFSGANLAGSNFSNACLAHAKLDNAVLDGANLSGANIGRASLSGASCVGVRFTEAIVHYTVMQGANCSKADFAGVTLLEIEAAQSIWQEADLTQATFIKGKLAGANFTKARLLRTTVLECELSASDFSEANVESTDFITCMLDGGKFDGSRGPNARFVYRSSLAGASFTGMQAPGANFRGTPLAAADFSGALLDGADFSEADCREAVFERASLKGALLMKTDFSKARMSGANLMEVVAQHAVFNGADMRDVNLYGSDLARVDVDTETQLDNAFMAKARTMPRHKVQPPGSAGGEG